ncbi:MAG: hypothetical protein HN891_08870 [Planctomycetes bacterium]|jgi:hypothetical protein|nr:hypothetical protein [Planctomycetota bacterium]MBT6451379.1 hypothetical protein [Planctomycetota bacterium]MBT6540843.1 hypothetical protein [Planctomycetota bacterium]MBT6783461.1 hypothetical protein [Planctomycetota bacterium]MBT6967939.1 hypothetical protein [Planctomycetota bacterium]
MKGSWRVRVVELLVGNTRNKLTSLLLAVVVWAYAFGNTGHEESIDAFLIVEPAAEDQVVISKTISQAKLMGQKGDPFVGRCKITLSGPRNVVARYVESELLPQGTLKVDRTGRIDLRSVDLFQLPQGLSVQGIDPSSLDVVLDSMVRVEKEVRASVRGTPGPGFVRFPGGISTDPEKITLEGPSQLLEQDVVAVLTQAIDIDGVVLPLVEATVPLVITGDDSKLIRIAEGFPAEATVKIHLQENLTQVQALVSVRYIVDEDVDLEIRGDQSIKVTVSGVEEAVREWKKRVDEGRFYLLVRGTDTGGEGRNIPREEVRWIDGSLPDGISGDQVKLERIILYSAKRIEVPGEEPQK